MVHQIAKKGWQPLPLKGGWQLRHPETEEAIYLSITDQWTSFVYPLDPWRIDGTPARLSPPESIDQPDQMLAERTRSYHILLERNEHMFMAKFCLDEQCRPLLTVEIPTRYASPLLLDRALASLIHYAAPPLPESILPDETPGLPREVVFRYINGIKASHWILKEEPRNLGQSWHLAYKGFSSRLFDVYLTLTRNWAYFQIPVLLSRVPSVLLEEDIRLQALFFKYLLQLNELWYMARLSLGVDSSLLLLLEIPTEALDFTLFQLATSTLATYLNRYGQEMQIMASLQLDQDLIGLLSKEMERQPRRR
jgi:hypothetical protein